MKSGCKIWHSRILNKKVGFSCFEIASSVWSKLLLLFHLSVLCMRHDISPFLNLNLNHDSSDLVDHPDRLARWPFLTTLAIDHSRSPWQVRFLTTLTSDLTWPPQPWPFLTQATISALTVVSLINSSRNQLCIVYTDTLLLLWYHEFTCFFTVRRQFLTEDWGMWISKSWAPSKMWFQRAAWFDLIKIRVIPIRQSQNSPKDCSDT